MIDHHGQKMYYKYIFYPASQGEFAMTGSCQKDQPRVPSESAVELSDDAFVVDAALIGELLDLPAEIVPVLMREGKITSACERGVDEHSGEFRLTFFHRDRRARLSTDLAGRILRRSVVDFGERRGPDTLR
jgi:Family of unknown function (DUF6522)